MEADFLACSFVNHPCARGQAQLRAPQVLVGTGGLRDLREASFALKRNAWVLASRISTGGKAVETQLPIPFPASTCRIVSSTSTRTVPLVVSSAPCSNVMLRRCFFFFLARESNRYQISCKGVQPRVASSQWGKNFRRWLVSPLHGYHNNLGIAVESKSLLRENSSCSCPMYRLEAFEGE